jgi:hypothetical protein
MIALNPREEHQPAVMGMFFLGHLGRSQISRRGSLDLEGGGLKFPNHVRARLKMERARKWQGPTRQGPNVNRTGSMSS